MLNCASKQARQTIETRAKPKQGHKQAGQPLKTRAKQPRGEKQSCTELCRQARQGTTQTGQNPNKATSKQGHQCRTRLHPNIPQLEAHKQFSQGQQKLSPTCFKLCVPTTSGFAVVACTQFDSTLEGCDPSIGKVQHGGWHNATKAHCLWNPSAAQGCKTPKRITKNKQHTKINRVVGGRKHKE